MLEGANDAARDTIASFEVRLRKFLFNLESNITAGLIKRPKGMVYVTCPTRQYKRATRCPRLRSAASSARSGTLWGEADRSSKRRGERQCAAVGISAL